MTKTGAEIIVEVLQSQGVTHVFGNPGSTEMAFIDALATGGISYVLGLHESCVIPMAEGYAQATGRPTVVNVHTMSGLGNSIGMLTNARVNGAPLIVTAGHQHERLLIADPILSHDLTGMTQTVTKWQHEPRNVEELGTVFRRAFNDVLAPPRGPVFVSLPMSLLTDRTDMEVPAASTISRQPVAGDLDRLAELLAEPEPGRTALILAIEVPQEGAIDAAMALAEALGCPVYSAANCSQGSFPPGHPLWAGMFPSINSMVRETCAKYDRVLFVGGQVFQQVIFDNDEPLLGTTGLLHLSSDPAMIGRAHSTEFGTAGALRPSLLALTELVSARVGHGSREAVLSEAKVRREKEIADEESRALALYGPAPIAPAAAVHAALRGAPDDIVVVDEAVSSSGYVRMYHRWTKPGRMFSAKQIIGWGMSAAVGVAIAKGGSTPVLSITSDGGATFSPQAVWTAAREKLPIVFVVLVNREYGILKKYLKALGGHSLHANDMRSVELIDPPIDYVLQAQSYGVEAFRVDHADALGDAVRSAFGRGGPVLIEVPMATVS